MTSITILAATLTAYIAMTRRLLVTFALWLSGLPHVLQLTYKARKLGVKVIRHSKERGSVILECLENLGRFNRDDAETR